jgi:hypothetical protein
VLVEDDAVAGDYSVELERAGRGPRSLATLRHGERIVVRSRSNRRVLHALAAYLSDHDRDDPPALHLHATPLVRKEQAVLAPRGLVTRAASVERLLSRAGIAVADGPGARLRGDPPRVVVPPALATFDLDGLGHVVDPTDEVSLAAPGEYELAGVVLSDVPFVPDVSTPARRVHTLVSRAVDFGSGGGQAGLDLAAVVVRHAPFTVVDPERVRASLAAIEPLFG